MIHVLSLESQRELSAKRYVRSSPSGGSSLFLGSRTSKRKTRNPYRFTMSTSLISGSCGSIMLILIPKVQVYRPLDYKNMELLFLVVFF